MWFREGSREMQNYLFYIKFKTILNKMNVFIKNNPMNINAKTQPSKHDKAKLIGRLKLMN